MLGVKSESAMWNDQNAPEVAASVESSPNQLENAKACNQSPIKAHINPKQDINNIYKGYTKDGHKWRVSGY